MGAPTDTSGAPVAPPEPGWYPDPVGGRGLRLWDGDTWTDRVRRAHAAPLPRWKVPATVVAAVVVVALLVWVGRGHGGHHAAARPATTVDCSFPQLRPAAPRVITWLSAHGAPINAGTTPAASPPGGCAAVTFAGTSGGTGEIAVYPSYAAAAARAPKGAIRASIYVITLRGALSRQQQVVKERMQTYVVNFSDPLVTPSTLFPTR